MRTCFESTIALALSLLVARTWLLQEFMVPTGSMADALRGAHRSMKCPCCGYPFDIGASPADRLPSLGAQPICPNCDAACKLDDSVVHSGDRLLVARGAFLFHPPRRFELALFRHPDDAVQAAVKRIVGLPGESIELRGGNLYADGKLVRKPLRVQRALAILVHDARHPPRDPDIPAHWQCVERASGWTWRAGRFFFAPQVANRSVDWLAYRHWRRALGTQPAAIPAPVVDTYGYNQGLPVIQWHEVGELLLTCRVRIEGRGRFVVKSRAEGHEFEAVFDTNSGQCVLYRDRLPRQRLACPFKPGRTHLLECSTIDCQFHCAVDGVSLFAPILFAPSGSPATDSPFELGAAGLRLKIDQLRLFRDVYYIPPPAARGSSDSFTYHLDNDSYFALGDNSPVSSDSRFWASPAIPDALLIGKPVLKVAPIGIPR